MAEFDEAAIGKELRGLFGVVSELEIPYNDSLYLSLFGNAFELQRTSPDRYISAEQLSAVIIEGSFVSQLQRDGQNHISPQSMPYIGMRQIAMGISKSGLWNVQAQRGMRLLQLDCLAVASISGDNDQVTEVEGALSQVITEDDRSAANQSIKATRSLEGTARLGVLMDIHNLVRMVRQILAFTQ